MKTRWMLLFVLIVLLGQKAGAEGLPEAGPEKFVPAAGGMRAAVVELKAEATITGGQIKLGHILRWSQVDAQQMDMAADLVVARFGPGQAVQTLDIEGLKTTLQGAGVNLGTIVFCGAVACKVTRSDAGGENKPVNVVAKMPELTPTTQPAGDAGAARSLREVLTADLADRLGVAPEALQIRFNGDDEKLVNISEPVFQFKVKPSRVKKLGEVIWEVTLTTGGKSQAVVVSGNARMWQDQLVTVRPLAYKQPIRDEDVTEKRVLVDRLPDDALLGRAEAVGQQAGRDLAPNTVLSGRMVEAVTLVKPGQMVTVLVESPHVQVRWVAEARESGSYGQSVRVRKPGTREEFSVILTGPQQGRLVGEASEGPKVAMGG